MYHPSIPPIPRLVPPPEDPWRRFRYGLALLASVIAFGALGYVVLGLDPLEALYQSVITVTTVGFRELGDVDGPYMVFTILLVLSGTGTALYLLGVMLETLVEGRLGDAFRRRRMERDLEALHGHVVVCGFGQVGQAICASLLAAGTPVVVVDREVEEGAAGDALVVLGDATDDTTLAAAGLERARALVVALDTDAGNVYVTLSGRSLRSDLFIVARATSPGAEAKLYRAGADRVVNPHAIGGSRMAALITAPHVADFLDVVMHDRELVIRIVEHHLPLGSPLAGRALADCHIAGRTGATLLAIRDSHGRFVTHPDPDVRLGERDVLIVLGTEDQHVQVHKLVTE